MTALHDKRAIITGAASGIGRAAARLFTQAGARVLAVDRDEGGLREAAAEVAADGGTLLTVVADAGEEAQVQGFVARCVREFGGIDVLFANAGIAGALESLPEQTVALWQEVLRVNLIGPFLAAREAAPHMRAARGGSIIFTASVAGMGANAGPIPYSASKAGLISLAQTLANDLYGTGIRVNAICPGLIETEITRPMFDDARARGKFARLGQFNPLARAGEAREIAALALFLASDAASYVNGQAIAADGGLTSTLPFSPGRRGF